MTRPVRPVRLGPRDIVVERRADGCVLLRSPHALGPYPRKLTERLDYWAARRRAAVPRAARRRGMAHAELRAGARACTQGRAVPPRAAAFGGAAAGGALGKRPRARAARAGRAVRRRALYPGRAAVLARVERLRQAALDFRSHDPGARIRFGPRRVRKSDRSGRCRATSK
jgi:hypothetical protein